MIFFPHNLEVLSKTRFWGPFDRLKPLNPPTRDHSGIARLKTVQFGRKATRKFIICDFKNLKETLWWNETCPYLSQSFLEVFGDFLDKRGQFS